MCIAKKGADASPNINKPPAPALVLYPATAQGMQLASFALIAGIVYSSKCILAWMEFLSSSARIAYTNLSAK